MKNPILNGLAAGAYIAAIVLVINKFTMITAIQKSIFIPMTMLSLFVFSAAVMGFLFVYEPAKLFMDNRRTEALSFFFRTLGTFAICVVIFVFLLLR